jgi:hypothetical protein
MRTVQVKHYFVGGAVVPLGEAAGGQGVPLGEVPALFGDVPEVLLLLFSGEDPGLLTVGSDEPGVGGAPFGVPAVPGAVEEKGPQGAPLGIVRGLFGVLGVPLGVVVFGLCGVVCGVAVPAGGVAVPAGGVAVLAGGVAVLAGGVAVPGAPELLAGGAPLAGLLWATTQLVHSKRTKRNPSFCIDMGRTSVSCHPTRNSECLPQG